MRISKSSRRWVAFLGRAILGVVIGIAFGTLFWALYLASEGKNIEEAIRGNVEDAIPTLQGLMLLGCMVGGAVGLFHGLIMARVGQRTQQLALS